MKEMVSIVPLGSCPNCGHSQFVVYEQDTNLYLTNRDGEIIDSKGFDYRAVGLCVKCHSKFDMIPTSYGFIPATRLRSILFDYTPHVTKKEEDKIDVIANPMEV